MTWHGSAAPPPPLASTGLTTTPRVFPTSVIGAGAAALCGALALVAGFGATLLTSLAASGATAWLWAAALVAWLVAGSAAAGTVAGLALVAHVFLARVSVRPDAMLHVRSLRRTTMLSLARLRAVRVASAPVDVRDRLEPHVRAVRLEDDDGRAVVLNLHLYRREPELRELLAWFADRSGVDVEPRAARLLAMDVGR